MAHNDPMDFGKLLKLFRRTARLSQEMLAERAGYSANYISMLERGVRAPAFGTIDALAEALHLNVADRTRLEISSQIKGSAVFENTAARLQTGSLIGRERDAAWIMRFFKGEGRLLTLTGPGGVGKTRLAAYIADHLGPDLANDSQFVDLSMERDLAGVNSAIARALKVREKPGSPLREGLLEFVRTKEILLVLDSMEHTLDAAPFIADLLGACSHLKILVTSRAPLQLREEQEFQVHPLAFPTSIEMQDFDELLLFPAITFFVHRARLVQPDFPSDIQTLKIVAGICQRVDGLPLAIELAAARVKHLPLAELSNRLEHRLQILTGGSRDQPERHQRMVDTIAWSYDFLQPAEKRIFQQLSCFVGTWNLEAAEAVCHIQEAEVTVMDALRVLVNNSLVILSEARYGMLDTIREFAIQQMNAAGETRAVMIRHAEYYLQFAKQAEKGMETEGQNQWHRILEFEHDNIRAALKWFMDNGEVEFALILASSVWRFWMLHGDFGEGRRWLEEGLSVSSDIRAEVRIKALWGAYWLAYHQGDYPHSAELSVQALALSDQTGDALDRRNALTGLGIAALAQGRFSEAKVPLSESVSICRKLNKSWHLATSLLNLSFAMMYSGDHSQASILLEEALEIYRKLGDRVYIAKTQNALGYAALLKGNFAHGEVIFRQTLHDFASLGEKTVIAESLEGLAVIFALSDRAESAIRMAIAARAVREPNASQPLPFYRETFQQGLRKAREQVSEAVWTAAWEERSKTTAEHAIVEAIKLLETV